MEKIESVFEANEEVKNNDINSWCNYDTTFISCKNDYIADVDIHEKYNFESETMPDLRAIKENLPSDNTIPKEEMLVLSGVKVNNYEKLEIKKLFEEQVDKLSKEVMKLVGKVSELVNLLEKI